MEGDQAVNSPHYRTLTSCVKCYYTGVHQKKEPIQPSPCEGEKGDSISEEQVETEKVDPIEDTEQVDPIVDTEQVDPVSGE